MSTFFENLISQDSPLKQKDNNLALFHSTTGIIWLNVKEIGSFTKNLELAMKKTDLRFLWK